MNRSSGTITISVLLLILFLTAAFASDPTYAQAASGKLNQTVQDGGGALEASLPALPEMPGRVEGVGTHFQLNNSEYVNVRVDCSQPIHIILESAPKMVSMRIESTTTAASATISLGGFPASTTYHKYEDDYHDHVAFTTDLNGIYAYTQDLSRVHIIFIQPRSSTIYLSDSGWSDPAVGTWDPATKTGKLTVDVTQTIQIDSNSITLDGNGRTVTGSDTGNGVYLFGRTGVTVKNLKVTRFTFGIRVDSGTDNTVAGNIVNSSYHGIYLYGSVDNTIAGNTANSNRDCGIILEYSPVTMVTGNTANSNKYGILLYGSSYSTVTGNTANSNSGGGILFFWCSSTIVAANTAESNSDVGIWLSNVSSNTVTGNTANSNSGGGILIVSYGGGNTLANNVMVGNANNFYLRGLDDDDYENDVGTSNTVDGKPIYYLRNVQNQVYDASTNAGTFYCISCNQVTIRDLTFTKNEFGILLYKTQNSRIENVQVSNNEYGILLDSSSSNTIMDSTANSNWIGISLHYSSENTVTSNTANSNYAGIHLYLSGSNTLTCNTVDSNSGHGIGIIGSSNKVYNNNFLSNPTQAYVTGGSGNVFYQSKPVGGNYWSNYDTPAEGCSDADSDGFCDTPYNFNGGQDALPWTRMNGWLGYYLTLRTDPREVATLVGEGRYNPGAVVTLQAPLLGCDGFVFLYWSVDGTNGGDGIASIAVTMDAPHTAIAHYGTSEDAIESLEKQVQSLGLNSGQTNSLWVKLNHALDRLNSGQTRTALNELNAFISQVNSFVATGILDPATGARLVSQAQAIISAASGV